MDFFTIRERSLKRGQVEIYPDFKICRSEDLMVRGKAFYAIWDAERGLWSTDEYDVQRLVDKELYQYYDEYKKSRSNDDTVILRTMRDFSSKSWPEFKKYVLAISDNSHTLDEKLTFANTVVTKKDYVSKRLPYTLGQGSIESYDKLMNTLYDAEEREKLEWAIGSVIDGDSKDIQKFIVLYGEGGKGKSTILHIVEKLFTGYYTMFDAKSLVQSSNSFSTEVFRSNPLVAIQHDGDLSRIEDNAKLNSIISHEEMIMNEKFKSSYTAKLNCFLFMATNKPVKITDAKSGIIRRLIDVKPSGRLLSPDEYFVLNDRIDFELGAIAQHCLDVYHSLGKNYYSGYKPVEMMFQTDVFYNFVEQNFDTFSLEEGVSLKHAYDMYKAYCDEALIDRKLPMYQFRSELKNYFSEYHDIARVGEKQVRSWYSGFLTEKFLAHAPAKKAKPLSLVLDKTESVLDIELSFCKAQYSTIDGKPMMKWEEVTVTLKDIKTHSEHYVKPPENMIVIDFDLKDKDGNKDIQRNLEEASKWPPTYAEFSKSGAGVHLHYYYDGDVTKLSSLVDTDIEVKVFTGGSSLRRKLSMCNSLPIAHISSGLPLRKEKMVNEKTIKTEAGLRKLISKALNKEIEPFATKTSIDFIKTILDEAYDAGIAYDVSDMKHSVRLFALDSTNNSKYCLNAFNEMKFSSKSEHNPGDYEDDARIVIFDCEVFPNLFLINWKYHGKNEIVHRMINPTPAEVERLVLGEDYAGSHKLVGFNNRRYDNHILYARYACGYSNEELFELSQKIIQYGVGFFGEAYNISYTDVYDFCSTKQSLKKWEIELGIHHLELGYPWDQPVPEDKWTEVAVYCDNDVLATEAVFDKRQADFIAREILADLAGMTVNDTTNSLTTRIIFGTERHPKLVYTDLATGDQTNEDPGFSPKFTNTFPGYEYVVENGKRSNMFRGVDLGFGGYVYSEPGIYYDVALLDVASLHPHSIIAMNAFGEYTKNYEDILNTRIHIKHKEYDEVRQMFGGKLAKYLNDESTADNLSQALKIAINSVYGLTSASFDNPFRDPRNENNIVALRGALFMKTLQDEVQARGYTVAHIKTDSIKIPNADKDIIDFCMEFAKQYGYTFEHEATYKKICLIDKAEYIAQYADDEWCQEAYGYVPKDIRKHHGQWTATGAKFQHPYIFKTLFSREPVTFDDMCETRMVKTNMYLDMNEYMIRDVYVEPDSRYSLDDCLRDPDILERYAKRHDIDISNCHNYSFVGKSGLFCPIRVGFDGGILLRENEGKYGSVGGTKGYRWLEAEVVKNTGKENDIDMSYYRELIDDAKATISSYGDFEIFAN